MNNERIITLLVISRAGWIIRGEYKYFQDNDGFYLDSIAPLCRKIIIISQQFQFSEKNAVQYAFQFTNNNVTVFDGMEPVSSTGIVQAIRNTISIFQKIRKADVVYSFVNTVRGSLYLLVSSWIFRKHTIAYNGIDWSKYLENLGTATLPKNFRLTLEKHAMRIAKVRIVTGPLLYERFKKYGYTYMASPVSSVLWKNNIPQNFDISLKDTKKNCLHLLCVAHLKKEKNIDVLLKTCDELKNKGINFIFNIVGDGKMRSYLEQLASELGILSFIRFHGYISSASDLRKHYIENDIFLFASEVEGFPRAIWEAVYFNLYVIMVKVGGVEKIFNDKEMSLLDTPNERDFANEILKIGAGNIDTCTSAERARQKFNSLFPDNPMEQLKKCFADLNRS